MTHDQIDRMVRRANPLPDLNALEPVGVPVLATPLERRTEMQIDDKPGTEVQPDRKGERRSPLPLIGLAAAVLIAIGITSLSREQVDTTLLDQPFTAVGAANGFLAAYSGYDADRAANYLADDVQLSGLDGAPDWRLGMEFMKAAGYSLLVNPCVDGGTTDSTTWVYCPYAFHALRSEELGEGPFRGNTFLVEFEGREITAVSRTLAIANGFAETMWVPFAEWMSENHPEEIEILYEDGERQTVQRVSEDSIPLWEQRTTEWLEVAAK